jgi:hypothetical protein
MLPRQRMYFCIAQYEKVNIFAESFINGKLRPLSWPLDACISHDRPRFPRLVPAIAAAATAVDEGGVLGDRG